MRPFHASRAATVLAAGILLLAACARATEQRDTTARKRTTLEVENRSFLDMNVYVVSGGTRIRLGRASGNATTEFVIPANLIFGATSLQFIADPIGAGRLPVSDNITVSEGDEVRLVIPPT
jgi:hypothetical protein